MASGRVLGAVAAAALLLAACGGPAVPTLASALPGPRGEMVLEFDEGIAEAGTPVTSIQNSGTAPLRIKVRTHGKGVLERAEGRFGHAVKTPAFAPEGPTPAAVIMVRPRGADQLSPDDRPFRWGADVLVDAEQGESETDNGDNVLQRGLFADDAQLKLQLDHDVPSCRVQGDAGEALVTADGPVQRERWYRVHCQLRNGRLSLFLGEPGRPAPQEWSVPADVGAVAFPRSAPIAIGGKLNGQGQVVPKSTDQFNGMLDNVFLDVS